jgi:hypothetical protein
MQTTVFPITIFTTSPHEDPFHPDVERHVHNIERKMTKIIDGMPYDFSNLIPREFRFDVEQEEITLRYNVELYGDEQLGGEKYHKVMHEIRSALRKMMGMGVEVV